jgi:predicted metalloendopeptidase
VENVEDKDYCFSKVRLLIPGHLTTSSTPTQGCIQTAADLLDKLDQTVNPCEDFYQFACGGYVEKTVIPDDRTRTSMFSAVGDKLNEQVRNYVSSV